MNQVQMLKAVLAAYATDSDRPHSQLIATRLPATPALGVQPVRWRLVNEDVVQTMREATGHTGVMNFASPTNPGGGVEYGAKAQEESIAKCTYLLPQLRQFEATYYAPNRENYNHGLFSASLIYSAHVRQVFGESGQRLTNHFVDVVTVAAPNRSAFRRLTTDQTGPDLQLKISQTLRAFKANGARVIILGAFGTGVFANPAAQVATIFRQELMRPEFAGAFDDVIFSIYDPAGRTFAAFQAILGE
ncbi:TIGR02452 family protein [Lacticaseibacillus salsurivasis]|uniref:TIGR02452 family protein n=1 Tax=Lacticaseibacillus salsurivasis TaxID=3081441 RepID=UPI0030C7026E